MILLLSFVLVSVNSKLVRLLRWGICLLPEYDNRLKKNLTIYQDVEYMNSVNINEVETKYTFTI